MTEKRITRAGILFLLICALLLCACAAPAAGSNGDTAASPQPSAPVPAPEQSPDASDPAAEPENTGDAGDRTVVYAATAEELLKALRPNTEVHLTGRSYNLSQTLGYGNFG